MKRILAMMLIGMLALSASGCLAEEAEAGITVATTTAIRGTFFAELYGATTADLDAQALLLGAETVLLKASAVDSNTYRINEEAMAGATARGNGAGTEYIFTLKEGLTWSDGSALTAQDYVFSVLMQSSPLMKEAGAFIGAYDRIDGWEAYSSGQSEVFSGVRLLNENSFSMTIAAEYLPDFYELADVSVFPCPMAVCAPGCAVTDEGNGAMITGGWTADKVMEYVSFPSVVSGPYRMDAFDPETMTADFSVNPYYCGSAPRIGKIRFMTVKNTEICGLMENGTVDVFVNATDIDAIRQLNALDLNSVEHDRRGLAFLALNCEKGPCTDVNVRKALACCVDREKIILDFLGGRGSRVQGWYGSGMWMIRSGAGTETLISYDEDLSRAASCLNGSRYTLNEDGTPYSGSGIRYAEGENGPERLTLTYFKTENNRCAQMIGEMLTENGAKLGMEIVVREESMFTESRQYYRNTEREYDVMFIATNFPMVYDPANEFATSESAQGYLNKSGLRDETLYRLAVEMRFTPAGHYAEYLGKFCAFQERFTRVLPAVPLYSNRYLTYWNDRLTSFHPETCDSWAQAILTAEDTGK